MVVRRDETFAKQRVLLDNKICITRPKCESVIAELSSGPSIFC